MSILDDWFGGSTKKRVTDKEYKKVKNELFTEGFTQKERNKIDQIFKSDYYEPTKPTHPKGLEKEEIEARVKWMRENKSKHGFSDKEISEVEASFKERL